MMKNGNIVRNGLSMSDSKRLAAENIAIATINNSGADLDKHQRKMARQLFREHDWFKKYVDSIYNCLEQK